MAPWSPRGSITDPKDPRDPASQAAEPAAEGAGSRFVRVASLAELPPGERLDVDVEDEVILLVNVAGAIYAVSAWCTHSGTSLALGRLNEETCALTCWAHLWSFDVRTGEPLWPPMARVARGFKLRTFPVKIEGDAIYVSPIPGTGHLG